MQDTAPPGTETTAEGRHRRPRRAHWGLRIGLAILVILAGLGVAAVRYYDWCQGASDSPREPVTFVVAEGASGSEIVDALHQRGVIRCGLVSKWLLRRSGHEGEFRAGTFELSTNMTPDEAFDILTTPPEPVTTVRLTIPEGYRLTQIAERVQEVLRIRANRFLRAAGETEWSSEYLPRNAPSLEGYLFPETYEFVEGATPGEVIRRLLDQFEAVAADLPWDNADDLPVEDLYDIVIVASMIEEEAALDDERAVIAGVIYNRLREGMVLGIDATLLYDDPTPDGQLSTSDLESDSPYNTRIHPGLPPTPIASPGLASLLAALEPADTPFFYYVLCGEDGHHEFGVTLEDHDQNRAECGE